MKKGLKISLSPTFFIHELTDRTWSMSFMVEGDRFQCRSRYLNVEMGRGDTMELEVRHVAEAKPDAPEDSLPEDSASEGGTEAAAEAEDVEVVTDRPLFSVILLVAANGAAREFNVGAVRYDGEMTELEVEEAKDVLTTVFQRAFFEAMCAYHEQKRYEIRAGAGGTPAEVVAYATPSSIVSTMQHRRGTGGPGWLRPRNIAVAAVVVAAFGLIGYGVMQSRAPANPLQEAFAKGDYSDLTEKIRKQMDENIKNGTGGSFGPLQGQNVAIDTLKAMGLDPGQANSGCLVGVK